MIQGGDTSAPPGGMGSPTHLNLAQCMSRVRGKAQGLAVVHVEFNRRSEIST